MRIAIVTDWFAPRRGGIESHLWQLAERLGRRGHAVDVITSVPDAGSGAHFRSRSLAVRRLPWADVALSPAVAGALRAQLRESYDVVHAHVSVVSPVGYVGGAIARANGLPTVVTFHSVLHAKQALLAAANVLMGIGRSAVVWSAVSRLVAEQATRALGARVLVLPNGIDAQQWPVARRDSPDIFTVITATRLHAKKRPRQLLRSFARAAARAGRPARLVIHGDGPERSRIESDIDAHGLRSGPVEVIVRGWTDTPTLRAAFGSADVFALASRNESFGLAALEARAAGLPVIAMTGTGAEEFLAGDPDADLCDDDEAFTLALADRMRGARRMSRTPSEAVRRYDWSSVLPAHEQAYELARTRAGLAASAAAR